MKFNLSSFTGSMKNKMQHLKLQNLVYRFLSAFLFTSFIIYYFVPSIYTSQNFYTYFTFAEFLLITGVLTLLLFFIKSEKTIRMIFIVTSILYAVLCALYVSNYYISFGLCILLFMALYFTQTDDLLNFKIQSAKTVWTFAIFLAIFFVIFTSVYTCMHYFNYGTPCFDFGLFSQMFHYMKETGKCLTTCERDKLLNHFAVHFSPIYYCLLPLYMLFPSPATLLIQQTLVVASGIIPLVLLCKQYKLSNTATVLFSICFTFFPAFSGGCSYYLHENCFLVPFLLWLFYFFEKENVPLTLLFSILTLCIKEDAAVYVAIIALYFLVSKKRPALSFSVFLLSIVTFVFVTNLMGVFGEGVMSDSRYGDYIYDDGGLFTVIKSVIQNPLFAIEHIMKPEKILFILQMFLPLCFLPLSIRKPAKLILLIPMVLIHLMTNYVYQYNIGYQYCFGTGAILFYLAITNFADLPKTSLKTKMEIAAAAFAVLLFCSGEMQRISYATTFVQEKQNRAVISEGLSLLPKDATVSASTFFIANLSNYDVIYELEATEQDSDYIVMDLREGKDVMDPAKYQTDAYETIYYHDDVIAIFKKV